MREEASHEICGRVEPTGCRGAARSNHGMEREKGGEYYAPGFGV